MACEAGFFPGVLYLLILSSAAIGRGE